MLSKGISTRNARAFWDERIAGLLNWIKAAKDIILAAEVFSIVLSFLFKNETELLPISLRRWMVYMRKSISLSVMKSATWSTSFLNISSIN
ncbi:hypothetical protein AZE41_05350 [Sporosarcina psychrophila]|nr:hypothetical protein AZE41_05350 [Sporosarcina psychrophila]